MSFEKETNHIPRAVVEVIKRAREYVPGAMAIGALMLAGCSSESVKHDHNKGAPLPPPTEKVAILDASIWSGYVTQNTQSFKTVEGKVVVPEINCDVLHSSVAFWVGYTYGNTVEQAGFTADCEGNVLQKTSKPEYYAWWMMFFAGSAGTEDLNIKPGDTVNYKVAYNGMGRYTMSVRDLSNGKHFSTTQTCKPTLTNGPDGKPTQTVCDPTTVEWVVERPGNSPLADFGKVTMFDNTATTSDGVTYPLTHFEVSRNPDSIQFFGLNMKHGKQLDRVSTPNDTGDFTVTWLAAGELGD